MAATQTSIKRMNKQNGTRPGCLDIVACLIMLLVKAALGGGLTVTDLKCDYTRDPLGVDSAAPRLFWKVQSDEQGQRQTAYEILAASSRELLAKDKGDLWDTGKVTSDQTVQIPYSGQALKSDQEVFWKVRAWYRDGRVSDWSKEATWTMGVISETELQAKWIGSGGGVTKQSPVLRRAIVVQPRIRPALGPGYRLGLYQVSL